ncbi:MAG: precorrin-6y C5,15-methyltransferase (decarboxylating) subunit CbiE [Gemmataceae bacterium]|nr:precorrin-6y C5,15-methyltransferase (decarboxylating) subunit CbiE [Gemmataceae bacterium]
MAQEPNKIHIIGVGSDGVSGVTGRARELLQKANLLVGSDNALGFVREIDAEKLAIGTELGQVVQKLESLSTTQRAVVVATGDPLFYGVARYLCDRLGKERFEVLPHVSTMQLAFARIKESWEEAYLTNLATHSLESVLDRIRTAETVGIFTSEKEDPSTVARQLLVRGIDYFRVYVCENLGGRDERVTQGELSEIQEMEFASLNVMILKRKPDRPDLRRGGHRFRRFGNAEDVFAQSRPKGGLITQAEVRALALAQLDVQPTSVVWDVGAGSGSFAIEAAQLASSGMVYGIEQDAADYHLIVANAETFGIKNLKAVQGQAPAVFDGLPEPDCVFIGATGAEVTRMLPTVYRALRPGGHMAVHVGTLENLSANYAAMKELAASVQVLLIQLSRGTDQLEAIRFEALNPTFLLTIDKPER